MCVARLPERSTRENFRSRRAPRVFHTTESRLDDDPFENNAAYSSPRSFYSGPWRLHPPPPPSPLIDPPGCRDPRPLLHFHLFHSNRNFFFGGDLCTVYYGVAENSQAISDVYLVRVVLDRSGRRIWFGGKTTWHIYSRVFVAGLDAYKTEHLWTRWSSRSLALKYFNY